MNKLFDFNPADYAADYKTHGYVYIPQGLKAEFHQVLTQQVETYLRETQLKDFAIGDKQQSLYQFPEGHDYFGDLLDYVAHVCGLDRRKLVLSERHIKAYDAGAAPNPLAHKDRYASEVSVGFSVQVPAGSRLVLYPYDELEVNPFNSSAELRASLSPQRLPETTLENARRVEIQDSARDVLMFRGNAIWHLRQQPANTTMLYLKLNTFHCDPLGEDPTTDGLRQATQAALSLPEGEFERLVPVLGRRVDYVHERYDRDWNQVAGVVLWGQKHLTLDGLDLRTLRAIDGRRNVAEVVRIVAGAGSRPAALTGIRRLAECGVVDLATPALSQPQTPVNVAAGWTKESLMAVSLN